MAKPITGKELLRTYAAKPKAEAVVKTSSLAEVEAELRYREPGRGQRIAGLGSFEELR